MNSARKTELLMDHSVEFPSCYWIFFGYMLLIGLLFRFFPLTSSWHVWLSSATWIFITKRINFSWWHSTMIWRRLFGHVYILMSIGTDEHTLCNGKPYRDCIRIAMRLTLKNYAMFENENWGWRDIKRVRHTEKRHSHRTKSMVFTIRHSISASLSIFCFSCGCGCCCCCCRCGCRCCYWFFIVVIMQFGLQCYSIQLILIFISARHYLCDEKPNRVLRMNASFRGVNLANLNTLFMLFDLRKRISTKI